MSAPPPDRRATKARIFFPNERPLLADELAQLDAQRLEPVIQTLAQGLSSYWNQYGEERKDLARVWGVHGALGQGKSTAVLGALQQLQATGQYPVRPLVHGWNWIRLMTQRHFHRRELLVTVLEASQFKAEYLNLTLISRLLLPRFMLWALPMSMLTTMAALSVLWALLLLLGRETWLITWLMSPDGPKSVIGAVLALPAAATLWATVTTWTQSEYSAGHLEQTVYRLARWMGVAPDLVVLDDLDRATVDQQRAVLRTLVRHTHLLHCPLVVCFDETDFLASDPNPEDPAELLRKLIQVPLRLPPRSREDAVLLAWGAARVWLQRNPDRQTWATFLRHPVWIGHLARVMLLTESVGPRRAKGLLADMIAAAETLYPWRDHQQVPLAEASALLLLSALHQMHPALRRDAEWLVSCLEAGGDDDAWIRWSESPRSKAFFKWIGTRPREEAQLRSLLRLADAMMPVRQGWRGVVFGGSLKPTVPMTEDGLVLKHNALEQKLLSGSEAYERWRQVGQALDRIADGIQGTEELELVHNKWERADTDAPPPLSYIWPMLIASLSQWPESRRLRVYTDVSRWLGRVHPSKALTLPEHWLLEWAVDRGCADHGSDDFWLDKIRTPDPAKTAEAAADADRTTPLRLAMLKALRRHRQPSKSLLQQSWQAAIRLAANSTGSLDGPLLAAAITQNGEVPPHAQVAGTADMRQWAMRFWPAVVVSPEAEASRLVAQDVLTAHMQAARTWLTDLPNSSLQADVVARDVNDRPWSLLQWMASHEARQMDLKQWLRVVAPLCAPPADTAHAAWSFTHWTHFVFHAPSAMAINTLDKQTEILKDLDPSRWAVGLCLLVQGWHGGMAPEHRAQLGHALCVGMPRQMAPVFATAAIAAWMPPENPGQPDTANPPDGLDTNVKFQAMPLQLEDAVDLIKRLLDAIELDNPEHRNQVDKFLLSWARTERQQDLDFYLLAKAHWECKRPPPGSGSDGMSNTPPDSLF